MERNTSFAAFVAGLAARIGGPGSLRFVLQPLVAILLGVRDGRLDAQAGRPPYVWGVLFGKGQRRAAIQQGAVAIAKPFVIAIATDAVLSYVTLGAVYPGETVAVACLLVALPYMIARAATNRLLRHRVKAPVEPPTRWADA
ncbi:MAG TPA: hypothetical protein VK066_26890 [Chloroflexota bacterium]|nr:hypothetical protein [Chloroflexota bacterium]